MAEETTFEQTDLRTRSSSKSKRGHAQVGSKGAGSQQTETESSGETESHETRISRKNGKSDGNAGQTKPLVVPAMVKGKTPLSATFKVSSSGSVSLTARSAEDGSTVTVSVRTFKIRNELDAFVRLKKDPEKKPPKSPQPVPGDPTVPPPGSGGPTTPGGGCGSGGDGGGTGGGTGGEAGGSAGGGTAEGGGESEFPTAPQPEPPTPMPPESPLEPLPTEPAPEPVRPTPHDRRDCVRAGWELPGDNGVPIRVEAAVVLPWGIASDVGALPGRVRVAVRTPLERAMTYRLASDPAGRLDFGDRETLVVPARTHGVAVPFHAVSSGPVRIVLTPIGEQAVPVSLPFEIEADSVAQTVRPAVWAAFGEGPRPPGAGQFVEIVRGDPNPRVTVGRYAFRDLATTATEITVEADDPFGVLAQPLGTISIPANATDVTVPLQLNDVEGTVELRLRGAGQTLSMMVRVVNDGWFAVDRIRVPAGAVVPVVFGFDHMRMRTREVSMEIGNTGVLDLRGAAEKRIDGSDPAGHFLVRALVPGSTVVTLRAAGLPDRTVSVEVVEPDVVLADGALRLAGLDPTRGGDLRLRVPDGASIESLILDENAAGITVSGLGTQEVVLQVQPDPNRSAELTLPIRVEGVAAGDSIQVFDGLHSDPGEHIVTFYQLKLGQPAAHR